MPCLVSPPVPVIAPSNQGRLAVAAGSQGGCGKINGAGARERADGLVEGSKREGRAPSTV